MSNQQEKPPLKCLLGIDPEKAQKCKPSECASCGWEAAEAARRREYVKEHGLTLCADGFRRLIIKKENDMATQYRECPLCGAHLDSGEKCDCRAAEADDNAEADWRNTATGAAQRKSISATTASPKVSPWSLRT